MRLLLLLTFLFAMACFYKYSTIASTFLQSIGNARRFQTTPPTLNSRLIMVRLSSSSVQQIPRCGSLITAGRPGRLSCHACRTLRGPCGVTCSGVSLLLASLDYSWPQGFLMVPVSSHGQQWYSSWMMLDVVGLFSNLDSFNRSQFIPSHTGQPAHMPQTHLICGARGAANSGRSRPGQVLRTSVGCNTGDNDTSYIWHNLTSSNIVLLHSPAIKLLFYIML